MKLKDFKYLLKHLGNDPAKDSWYITIDGANAGIECRIEYLINTMLIKIIGKSTYSGEWDTVPTYLDIRFIRTILKLPK